jgi:hypothetical protein
MECTHGQPHFPGTLGNDLVDASLLPPGDFACSELDAGMDSFLGSAGPDEAWGAMGMTSCMAWAALISSSAVTAWTALRRDGA